MQSFVLSTRRTLVALGAVLALSVAGVGAAAAQQATPSPSATQAAPTPNAYFEALARRLNVTPDALRAAMEQARTDAGLPADGRGPGGPGHGPGGPGGAGRAGGPGGFGPGASLDAAAQAIGISTDQLRQELPGKSLAQVAQAHGKTGADVAAALKTTSNQRIDQLVNEVVPQRGAPRPTTTTTPTN